MEMGGHTAWYRLPFKPYVHVWIMAPTPPDDLCFSKTSPAFRVQRRSLPSECELCPRGRRCCCVLGWEPGNYSQQGGSSGNNVQGHLPVGVDLSHGKCACAHTEALRSWQLNTGLDREDGTGPSRHWTVPIQHISALKRRAPLPSTSIPHPKTPVPPLSLLQLARLRGSTGYIHTLPRPWGWGHEASFSLSP